MLAMPARNTLTVLVAGAQTGGRFAIVEARERQGAEPPRHIHSREDEFIYVLEGRLTIERDGQHFEQPSGSGLFLPCGSEHAYTVETPEALLLITLEPAGLEDCLGDLSQPGPAGALAVERLVGVAARYGVTITGPARPP